MSTTTRVTVEQYHVMIRAGAFEPRERHHVELLEGEILPMSPVNPLHSGVIDLLTEWSFDALPRGTVSVRVQQPVDLAGFDSEPEPDLVWAVRRDYRDAHPTPSAVLLLLEVSESSLARDCGAKAALYARAGVADYWVVNLVGRTVEVRRRPERGAYGAVTVHGPGQTVSPLAFPGVALDVSRLFPA